MDRWIDERAGRREMSEDECLLCCRHGPGPCAYVYGCNHPSKDRPEPSNELEDGWGSGERRLYPNKVPLYLVDIYHILCPLGTSLAHLGGAWPAATSQIRSSVFGEEATRRSAAQNTILSERGCGVGRGQLHLLFWAWLWGVISLRQIVCIGLELRNRGRGLTCVQCCTWVMSRCRVGAGAWTA